MSEPTICATCQHWKRDPETRDYLQLNFMVGRCQKGRMISHGITRCHDTCELHETKEEELDPMAERVANIGCASVIVVIISLLAYLIYHTLKTV